jgi:hypothetical protein
MSAEKFLKRAMSSHRSSSVLRASAFRLHSKAPREFRSSDLRGGPSCYFRALTSGAFVSTCKVRVVELRSHHLTFGSDRSGKTFCVRTYDLHIISSASTPLSHNLAANSSSQKFNVILTLILMPVGVLFCELHLKVREMKIRLRGPRKVGVGPIRGTIDHDAISPRSSLPRV